MIQSRKEMVAIESGTMDAPSLVRIVGYASRSGKAAVLESLGLPGWGCHAKDEYIEIDAIVPRLYLSTRLLMDLARE